MLTEPELIALILGSAERNGYRVDRHRAEHLAHDLLELRDGGLDIPVTIGAMLIEVGRRVFDNAPVVDPHREEERP